jgi:hypothetical protein
MAMSPAFQLVSAASGLALGLFMLAAPERFRRNHLRNRDREIADRLARGTDAYFEELRTLEAYRRPGSVTTVRFFGGLLTLLGGAMIVMALTGAGR